MVHSPSNYVDHVRSLHPPGFWEEFVACPAIALQSDGSAKIDDTHPEYLSFLEKWKGNRQAATIAVLPGAAKPRNFRKPGDLAEWMVKQAGFSLCGKVCRAFQAKMNGWGWGGCLIHRQEIVDWFVSQAGKHGVKLTSEDAAGLFKAAVSLAIKQRLGKSK